MEATEAAGAAPPPSDHWAAVLASFLGWTLDAFDFFLVVMCLTAIGAEFDSRTAPMALTLTVTLAFRPRRRASSSGSSPTATAGGCR